MHDNSVIITAKTIITIINSPSFRHHNNHNNNIARLDLHTYILMYFFHQAVCIADFQLHTDTTGMSLRGSVLFRVVSLVYEMSALLRFEGKTKDKVIRCPANDHNESPLSLTDI